MAYAFVFLVAVAVAVAVYLSTVRGGRPIAEGFGSSSSELTEQSTSGTYVPVTPVRPDWQSRLTGFLGLVIAVVVGAVLLAVTIYVGVERLVRLAADAITD